MNFEKIAYKCEKVMVELTDIFVVVRFLCTYAKNIFKNDDIQNMNLTPDKELNILIKNSFLRHHTLRGTE